MIIAAVLGHRLRQSGDRAVIERYMRSGSIGREIARRR